MSRQRSRSRHASSQSGQHPDLLATRPRRGSPPKQVFTRIMRTQKDESAAGNAEPADLCIRRDESAFGSKRILGVPRAAVAPIHPMVTGCSPVHRIGEVATRPADSRELTIDLALLPVE